jgi:hypothetical protein
VIPDPAAAAVPVYVDGRFWGQLWFATDHGEPPFEARDTETLMAVATSGPPTGPGPASTDDGRSRLSARPEPFPGRSAGAALHSIGTSARHELALSTRE